MKSQLILLILPVVSISIAWACGKLRLGTTFAVFLGVEAAATTLFFLAMGTALRNPGLSMGYLATAFLLSMFAPWLTFLFGFCLSKQAETAPIVHVAKAAREGAKTAKKTWDNLDDQKKEEVIEGAKKAVRFGAKHLGAHLRCNGKLGLAAAVLGAMHLI